MWTHLIVVFPKAVKASLLLLHVLASDCRMFVIHRLVDSLMNAVFCWAATGDALWPDPQLDPPNTQLTQATRAGKGSSIV
jgi:hypothetical protein